MSQAITSLSACHANKKKINFATLNKNFTKVYLAVVYPLPFIKLRCLLNYSQKKLDFLSKFTKFRRNAKEQYFSDINFPPLFIWD